MRFIAEVKTQSPHGFKSEKTWDELFAIADKHGDMLSIHTNPLWGGSFALLRRARIFSNKPILAKGVHSSDDEIETALDLGASAVLVVGRLPKLSLIKYCYIEPLNLVQGLMIPHDVPCVWNSRNLFTGKLKEETIYDMQNFFPGDIIQASNIKTMADVKPSAYGFIVGENLVNFCQSK
jgi:indole-3-glycerol phosphate synthase